MGQDDVQKMGADILPCFTSTGANPQGRFAQQRFPAALERGTGAKGVLLGAQRAFAGRSECACALQCVAFMTTGCTDEDAAVRQAKLIASAKKKGPAGISRRAFLLE